MSAEVRSLRRRRIAGLGPPRILQEEFLLVEGRDAADVYSSFLLDIINLKYSNARRLSQLNFLVRYSFEHGPASQNQLDFRKALRFLMVTICDPCKEIRSASFRLLRHWTHSLEDCQIISDLHIDYCIARSLDMVLDNETESVQVLQLVRKFIHFGHVSSPILSSILSIASEKMEEREKLTRASLEILSEILILCPDLADFDLIAIIRVLMDFLLSSTCAPLSRAIVAALTYFAGKLRQKDSSRQNICDLPKIFSAITTLEGFDEKAKIEVRAWKKQMVQAAQMAIVGVLRTWEGLFLLTTSARRGIQSLVQILFLPTQSAQGPVLEIIAQLLFLPKDLQTPTRVPDTWSLSEKFVAAEARSVLPHVGSTRLNLCANYLSVVLFILHQSGLVEGLISVITISRDPLCQSQALFLLDAFLSSANIHLPAEFNAQIQSLPELVKLASSPALQNLGMKNAGSEAMSDLFHSSSQRGIHPEAAVPMSLFLTHLIEMNAPLPISVENGQIFGQESEVVSSSAGVLGDSHVLITNEAGAWNWQIVLFILKANLLNRSSLDHIKFLHRLFVFFKPSNKLFSLTPRKNERSRIFSICGNCFIDILLSQDPELLEEFLIDLESCLTSALKDPVADAIFNPLQLLSSCSAVYFIFIGRISASASGSKLLEKTGIFHVLRQMVQTDNIHESYLKLIVTTLDYRHEGPARDIYRMILASSSLEVRHYAILHLRTLLRIGFPDFSQWGMEMLLESLKGPNLIEARTAAKILDEACDIKSNLNYLIQHDLPMDDLIYPLNHFLTARVVGSKNGFDKLRDRMPEMMHFWRKEMCLDYVRIVEELANLQLFSLDIGDTTQLESKWTFLPELLLPEHLYGQLVQHEDGCDLVRTEMPDLVDALKNACLDAGEVNASSIKASLWALGHIGRTGEGMAILSEFAVIDSVVALAADNPILSIRGTAFFVLGLWSVTERGADLLKSRDWLAVRHDRSRNYSLVDQRVHYTWQSVYDGAGCATWVSSNPGSALSSSSSYQYSNPASLMKKPTKMISFTLSPLGGFEFARKISQPNDGHISDGNRYKTSRGESGFESSDGTLDPLFVDGYSMDNASRYSRSESEHISEHSGASYGSPYDVTLVESDPSPGADRYSAPNTLPRKGGGHILLQRQTSVTTPSKEKRGKSRTMSFFERTNRVLSESVDQISPPKAPKSDTRRSFRSITNAFRQGKVKSRKTSSALSSTASESRQHTPSFISNAPPLAEENAMKEEKFIGLALPLKRYLWPQPSGQPVVLDPAVFIRSTSRNRVLGNGWTDESANGLELHSVENCIVCHFIGKDMSIAEKNDAPVVLKRKEVLRFMKILASPMGHKGAEQGLLQLKAQLADSFLDCCLYTEISLLLSTYSYPLKTRRLVQELFFDAPLQKALSAEFEEMLALK